MGEFFFNNTHANSTQSVAIALNTNTIILMQTAGEEGEKGNYLCCARSRNKNLACMSDLIITSGQNHEHMQALDTI